MRSRLLLGGGIVLMVAGAIAMGFVADALWIGGADTGASQQDLAAEFDENLAAATSTIPQGPADDDPTMVTVATAPPPEDTIELPTTAPIPGVLHEMAPAYGGAMGRIVIPAAGVDWVMVEGVSLDVLSRGPGHMPGTPLPGQPGNAVISGHRTTNGAPFFDLDLLVPGDDIFIETLIGTHTYQVVEVLIVAPTDIWVTGRADGAWLTLTTCNPKYRAIQRLVVFARLVEGPNMEAIAPTLTGEETPPHPRAG